MRRRERKDNGARGGREQPMYTSLEKLWLFSDIELKWQTKQQMPNSSDLERNISFSQNHFIIADPS
jgi:hypothetical protein